MGQHTTRGSRADILLRYLTFELICLLVELIYLQILPQMQFTRKCELRGTDWRVRKQMYLARCQNLTGPRSCGRTKNIRMRREPRW